MIDWKNMKTNFKIKYPFPDIDARFRNASMSQVDCLNDEQAAKLDKWIRNPHDFLYIYSPPGVGKTHLSAAIAIWYHERNLPVYYFSEHKLFTMTSMYESDGKPAEWKIQTICDNPLVVWDDLGSTLIGNKNSIDDSKKIALMKQFFHSRYEKSDKEKEENKKVKNTVATIITSNYSPEQLKQLLNDERISDRLRATENLILEVIGPNRRQEGL